MIRLLRTPGIAIWIFLFAFLVHFAAVYSQSGSIFLTLPILYGVVVVATFFVFSAPLANTIDGILRRIENSFPIAYYPQILLLIDIIVIFFPLYYYVQAGSAPFLDMISSDDYYYKSGIRNQFYQHLDVFDRYLGEYYMRGLAPFWLAYSLFTGRKAFWLMLVSTSLFALFLVTKSIAVLMILPSIVVAGFLRRWYTGVVLVAVVVAILAINVIAPHLNTRGELMLPAPSEESGALGVIGPDDAEIVDGGTDGATTDSVGSTTHSAGREALHNIFIVVEALKIRLFDAGSQLFNGLSSIMIRRRGEWLRV